jgi:phosphoglycolate phosphatase
MTAADRRALHAAIESFKRHYTEVNGRFTQIYPGVLDGLQAWQASGLKMGVVTNKPGMFTERCSSAWAGDYLRRDRFRRYHRPQEAASRAHPARLPPVRRAADRNLHIGDSENDVHAAHAAGCRPSACPTATTRASRWTAPIAMR